MSKMDLLNWPIAHLQVVIQGPRLLPHCSSVISNVWFPVTVLFCRDPVEGERGMVQVWKSHSWILLLFHWWYSVIPPRHEGSGKRATASSLQLYTTFVGQGAIDSNNVLIFSNQACLSSFSSSLQWAWLLLLEAGESPICISLYIGTIFSKFLSTDSRFQFPSNLLWSKNPETGHTILFQGSARCCQEELFKEKHPTGCTAIKIAETLPQGECRDLSFSLVSHSLRLGLYNSMFEALGCLYKHAILTAPGSPI